MLTHSRSGTVGLTPTKNHSHSTLHVADTVMRALKIVDVGDPTRDRSRQDALRRRCSDRQRGSTLRRSAATETGDDAAAAGDAAAVSNHCQAALPLCCSGLRLCRLPTTVTTCCCKDTTSCAPHRTQRRGHRQQAMASPTRLETSTPRRRVAARGAVGEQAMPDAWARRERTQGEHQSART